MCKELKADELKALRNEIINHCREETFVFLMHALFLVETQTRAL